MARLGKGARIAVFVGALCLAMIVPPLIAIAMRAAMGDVVRTPEILVETEPRGDDDGELHDGWRDDVSYTKTEEHFEQHEEVDSEAYGTRIRVDLDIVYPQFEGEGAHIAELNEAVRKAAMAFREDFVENPTEAALSTVGKLSESGSEPVELADTAVGAVTYNTEDFVSVSFSDLCHVGAGYSDLISLKCVNVNLKTGVVYTIDDVLTMNEAMANRFVDALVENAGEDDNGDGVPTEDECLSVSVIGRDEWVKALLGEGDYATRVTPTFFVDENGRFNLAASYGLNKEGKGFVYGWWDATIEDELLEGCRKESDFWALLGSEGTDASAEVTEGAVPGGEDGSAPATQDAKPEEGATEPNQQDEPAEVEEKADKLDVPAPPEQPEGSDQADGTNKSW